MYIANNYVSMVDLLRYNSCMNLVCLHNGMCSSVLFVYSIPDS